MAEKWRSALFGITLCVFAGMVRAEDPPSRVARINYLSGSVSFKPGSLEDWGSATANYPLTSGDELWTDRDARAELRDGRTILQLGPETAFTLYWLDDHITLIGLTQGTIFLRVNKLLPEDSFELTTPNAAVTLLKPGTYRVEVEPSGENTRVTVRGSEAEVTAAGVSFNVEALQEARVTGPLGSSSYDIVDAPLPDDFDRWCRDRDRMRKDSPSAQHVSREMIGYEDLDDSGTWTEAPDYGWVWRPTTIVGGWAPYRFGRWAWADPWGWTWVDDASWGFAPFHYGRWAWWSGGWVWAPGPVFARPVYAPALVGFVGGGAWSASFSFGAAGGVAWFPLAPGEPFVPVYRVSPVYLRAVNVRVTSLAGSGVAYVNRSVAGAVTAVSRDTIVASRPVGSAAVAVPARAIAGAPVAGSAPAVAPRAESVLAHGTSSVRPPARAFGRPVVSRMAGPPAPVPFAAKERALAAQPGRPLDSATLTSLRAGGSTATTRPSILSATTTTGTLRPARDGITQTHAAQPSSVSPGTARNASVYDSARGPNLTSATAAAKKAGGGQGAQKPAAKPNKGNKPKASGGGKAPRVGGKPRRD